MTQNPSFKILIVDDDETLRHIYRRYLTAEGFEVLEASTGEEALRGFRESPPDVILLDLRLHAHDGKVLASALRHAHPQAKIVVSSCYDLAFQKTVVGDAEDYFEKSDGCRALLSKIRRLVPDPRPI